MTIELASIGSYHVGGRYVDVDGLAPAALTPVAGMPPIEIDPNGRFMAGQMYVQVMRLAAPRHPLPLALWHGGGLTGSCWESTPDGRPGWQSFFLRNGFDILVCDAAERGRAGWARFPQIFAGEPIFMPPRAAWRLYRVGDDEGYSDTAAERRGHPGTRFPIAAFDAFVKQIVPRWPANDPWIEAAYLEMIETAGPLHLVAHSQGAAFAMRAAAARPDLVRALVLVEPGGVPALDTSAYAALASVPTLVLWGDFVDRVDYWRRAHASLIDFAHRLGAVGGRVDRIDLPDLGHRGNSHLLMMDRESDAIADIVRGWLTSLPCEPGRHDRSPKRAVSVRDAETDRHPTLRPTEPRPR